MSQQDTPHGSTSGPVAGYNIVVVAVVLIVLIFVAGLAIVLLSGSGHNDLSADLNWSAVGDGGIVFVSVYGEISNTGDEAVAGVVLIKVWDGSEWRIYSETTDLIPAHGSTVFTWWQLYDAPSNSEFDVELRVSEA